LILNQLVWALDPSRPITQYGYSFWTIKHGLPDTTIWSIAQTPDGYIWLGTPSGLVRFDGVRFVNFRLPSEKEATVENLRVSKDGSLWICSYNYGLFQLKDGQIKTYSKENGLSSHKITTVYQDQQDNIWIGTLYSGINLLKDNKITVYDKAQGLIENQVNDIAGDSHGNIWIATNGGISKFREGGFTNYTVDDGLPDNRINDITIDQNGIVWFATAKGLVKLKDQTFTAYTEKDGLSRNEIDSIVEDKDGNLWIGTRGGGLNRMTNNSFTSFTSKDGLSSDDIRVVFEDKQKNIWVGTRGGGLCQLKERPYTLYTAKDGLANNHVIGCVETIDGSIWCGTLNGLSRYKDGKFITYTLKDGLADNHVMSIAKGVNNTLWIGTMNGLSKLHGNKFTSYTTKDGLVSDKIVGLYTDREGSLWVTSKGVIQRLKNGEFDNYPVQDSDAAIKVIYEDSNGNLWFGGGGLSLLKDGKVITYTTKDGLISNSVKSIYEDQDGALWIGTRKGLSRYKDRKFNNYSIKDGLVDEYIIDIFEDGEGYFWISNKKGFSRISRKELNDYAENKTRHISVLFFEREDSNRNITYNGVGDFRGCKIKDGSIWFPSLQGIVVINPSKSVLPSEKVPVYIEEVLVDKKPVDLKDYVYFAPGSRELEIRYTGISFISPENLHFKYILDGFDKDWIDANNRRVAYYTNLPPGEYSFKVIARNMKGIWNEEISSFQFYLKPRFYQTYWFYALCLVSTGLLGWTIYFLRMKHLESKFSAAISERTRIARELHDTLLQDIAAIAMKLELISQEIDKSPSSAKKELDQVIITMDDCQNDARKSIENLRTAGSKSNTLCAELENIANNISSDYPVQVHLETLGLPYPLPKDFEENLAKICKEAVNNAIKHGKAQYIDLKLIYDPEWIQLKIQDDGCGFDASAINTKGHYGLTGMKERAIEIGGNFSIYGQNGTGTKIMVEIPISGV
jgi:ligand-binding sensor domain-containing protein/two-component sensor histidine kinase